MAEPEIRKIIHVDMDAFYASVEQRDNPELRGKPVAVGGAAARGVVAAASYEARAFGVRSAMPSVTAARKCPELIFVKPRFEVYRAVSQQIREIFADYTPLIEPLSLDEAYLDVTDNLKSMPIATEIAEEIRARIRATTGLNASAGISYNKFLAKIASELDKPRGFSAIGAAEAKDFLANKPVNILPGVGPATVSSLAELDLRTVGDIASADLKLLANRLGSGGMRLHRLAHGQDSRIVDPDQARKTISAETTFNDDLHKRDDLEDELWPLCEKVAKQARKEGVAGRVATLKLRTPDFKIHTRRRTLAVPTQTARTLFQVARELLAAEPKGLSYRLIGAGLTEFVDAETAGSDMFADDERRSLKSETAIDALRGKFGAAAVVTGRALKSR